MAAPGWWLKKDFISMTRMMRLAMVQNQFDVGNLTEEQARCLLARPLTPGNDSTYYDDSEWLNQYDRNDPSWHPLDWVCDWSE